MSTPVVAEAGGTATADKVDHSIVAEAERQLRWAQPLHNALFTDSKQQTTDSFQNFALNLGYGTDNTSISGSTYGYSPVSRVRTLLEWIHRGAWLGGVAVDLVADDMTKSGTDITTPLSTKEEEAINDTFTGTQVWGCLNDAIKWSRLYGGSIAVILIEGHDLSTPLRESTVGRDSFMGLAVFDRWMLEPSFTPGGTVQTPGPHLGMPIYYKVTGYAHAMIGQIIHYSRCIRFEGIRLPYWQRVAENTWGISVLERLYDRMIAFDAATMGAAQLVHKSYLRVFKVKDLRAIAASEGEILQQFARYAEVMRKYQGIEGMTMIDAEDDFQAEARGGFGGISEALMQFGQQLAGALQIPLVRLFGMSPAGLNSSGESDLRTYYDGINSRQEKDMRVGLAKIYRVVARSLSIDLGSGFNYIFRPLWQLTEKDKAEIASSITVTVNQSFELGIIKRSQALKEYRALSRLTGVWATITEEDIEEAEHDEELAPPLPGEFGMGELGEPDAGGLEGETASQEMLRPPQPHLPRLPHSSATAGAHMPSFKPRLKLMDGADSEREAAVDRADAQDAPAEPAPAA